MEGLAGKAIVIHRSCSAQPWSRHCSLGLKHERGLTFAIQVVSVFHTLGLYAVGLLLSEQVGWVLMVEME